ncbi:hypothetical protein C5616_23830, partial [Vibrio anguillarum]|nr:hypothetical protein [Vibrio anguillarum]
AFALVVMLLSLLFALILLMLAHLILFPRVLCVPTLIVWFPAVSIPIFQLPPTIQYLFLMVVILILPLFLLLRIYIS